ncbi:MAG TPA: hypothetical protein VIF14_18060 [Alphaproteobacteria bacterium]|jgi:hypothetical protein
MRLHPVAAVLVAGLALSACETAKSVNPFAKSSPYQTHCRAALDSLVAREREKVKISVEDSGERPRDNLTAVTIVYVQGESRRLFTCLYQPDQPNRMFAASYRGQGLTPAQLDEVNAAAARR